MSGDPSAVDPWAEAATLIANVGRNAEEARRYRELATSVGEPAFERALAIGSEVRIAARSGTPDALPPLLAELGELAARCREAVAALQSRSTYREATSAFRNGDAARAGELACVVFADVVPEPRPPRTFFSVGIAQRGPEHFVPAAECAARIEVLRREGLSAPRIPPERGGDAAIRPVVLSERLDPLDSPIALAIEPGALPGPVCRLDASDVLLFYGPRLRASFTVAYAARAEDEWWRVRPAAYRRYVNDLRAALGCDLDRT